MSLKKCLSTISKGTTSVSDYLHSIQLVANELALISYLVDDLDPNKPNCFHITLIQISLVSHITRYQILTILHPQIAMTTPLLSLITSLLKNHLYIPWWHVLRIESLNPNMFMQPPSFQSLFQLSIHASSMHSRALNGKLPCMMNSMHSLQMESWHLFRNKVTSMSSVTSGFTSSNATQMTLLLATRHAL